MIMYISNRFLECTQPKMLGTNMNTFLDERDILITGNQRNNRFLGDGTA